MHGNEEKWVQDCLIRESRPGRRQRLRGLFRTWSCYTISGLSRAMHFFRLSGRTLISLAEVGAPNRRLALPCRLKARSWSTRTRATIICGDPARSSRPASPTDEMFDAMRAFTAHARDATSGKSARMASSWNPREIAHMPHSFKVDVLGPQPAALLGAVSRARCAVTMDSRASSRAASSAGCRHALGGPANLRASGAGAGTGDAFRDPLKAEPRAKAALPWSTIEPTAKPG